jgi:hypothetical protein
LQRWRSDTSNTRNFNEGATAPFIYNRRINKPDGQILTIVNVAVTARSEEDFSNDPSRQTNDDDFLIQGKNGIIQK